MVEGYIKTLCVKEYSKHTGVDEYLQNIGAHVVWECKCGEINIDPKFDYKKPLQKFRCDKCKKMISVNVKDKEDVLKMLDMPVVEDKYSE